MPRRSPNSFLGNCPIASQFRLSKLASSTIFDAHFFAPSKFLFPPNFCSFSRINNKNLRCALYFTLEERGKMPSFGWVAASGHIPKWVIRLCVLWKKMKATKQKYFRRLILLPFTFHNFSVAPQISN
jgi:hypothetical protein